MSKILIGCVGDDFSGSSDAASFFAEAGVKTLLFNGIPNINIRDYKEDIAVVIALKIRNEETTKAVAESLKAFNWLNENGAAQLYFKYCSTFDSTRKGNIGPIIDNILETYNIKYTILCPALPVNGRTVVNGHLYVNGIPLNKSSMKNHPLNPMWDSDISRLMAPQGKYPCLIIDNKMLEQSKETILKEIEKFGRNKEHFYVIPDYFEEKHSKKIIDVFGDLKLLTGGSGLITQLSKKYKNISSMDSDYMPDHISGKVLVLSGSCSKTTLGQIDDYISNGGKYIKIDPIALINGSQTKEGIWHEIEPAKEDMLVYSSDNPENVKKAQKNGSQKISNLIEQTFSYLAKKAVENGCNGIIVAGGETSGAVTKTLGYESYLIGRSISPGIPVMTPLSNLNLRLVLKSGNFGQKDFFFRAINIIKT